ncbi:hypothetical protein AYI68_g7441 [Smittium mucronatum]|uniref:Uncharacterized protein n=1 Tax=Smittium mucronatum TaxID=133383 RepID=A0A1R0GNQ4_9FUNG|nr:hypothetical protein AYI68_g7441 [Smittium mucronatum]
MIEKRMKSLPKGWYWMVQPAKYVLEEYKSCQEPLFCPKESCNGPTKYNKDSNGHKANTHAEFKCKKCGGKYRPETFFVKILKRNASDLPAATSWESLLPQSQSKKTARMSTGGKSPRPPSSFREMEPISDEDFSEMNIISNQLDIETASLEPPESPVISGSSLTPFGSSIGKKRAFCESDEDNTTIGQKTFFKILKKYKNDVESSLNQSTKQIVEENKMLKEYLFNLTEKIDSMSNRIEQLTSENKAYNHNPLSRNPRSSNQSDWSEHIIHPAPSDVLKSPILQRISGKKSVNPGQSAVTDDLYRDDPVRPLPSNSLVPTIHRMAVSQNLSGTISEYNRISNAIKSLAGYKKTSGTLKSEIKHNVSRVFVDGVERTTIKQVKSDLKDLRFKLSKVLDIRFIGKHTIEFTVTRDYTDAFLSRLSKFTLFNILKKLNPTIPLDKNASPETRDKVKDAYRHSLATSIRSDIPNELKEYFKDLAIELGLDIDSVQSPPTPPKINESVVEFANSFPNTELENINRISGNIPELPQRSSSDVSRNSFFHPSRNASMIHSSSYEFTLSSPVIHTQPYLEDPDRTLIVDEIQQSSSLEDFPYNLDDLELF